MKVMDEKLVDSWEKEGLMEEMMSRRLAPNGAEIQERLTYD